MKISKIITYLIVLNEYTYLSKSSVKTKNTLFLSAYFYKNR